MDAEPAITTTIPKAMTFLHWQLALQPHHRDREDGDGNGRGLRRHRCRRWGGVSRSSVSSSRSSGRISASSASASSRS